VAAQLASRARAAASTRSDTRAAGSGQGREEEGGVTRLAGWGPPATTVAEQPLWQVAGATAAVVGVQFDPTGRLVASVRCAVETLRCASCESDGSGLARGATENGSLSDGETPTRSQRACSSRYGQQSC
jgi:hypothetical protein